MAVSGEISQYIVSAIDIDVASGQVAEAINQVVQLPPSVSKNTELVTQLVRFMLPGSGILVAEQVAQIVRFPFSTTKAGESIIQTVRQTHSYMFESAFFLETLTRGSPPGAIAETVLESLTRTQASGQISSVVVSVLSRDQSSMHMSAEFVSVLSSRASTANVAQDVVSTLRYSNIPKAALSSVFVEVLRQRKLSKGFGLIIIN